MAPAPALIANRTIAPAAKKGSIGSAVTSPLAHSGIQVWIEHTHLAGEFLGEEARHFDCRRFSGYSMSCSVQMDLLFVEVKLRPELCPTGT